MTTNPTPPDPTGLYPFTYSEDGPPVLDPQTEYILIEKAMYDMTLERVRELNVENASLKDKAKSFDIMIDAIMGLEPNANKKNAHVETLLDFAKKNQELEGLLLKLDEDLTRAELDHATVGNEVLAWRKGGVARQPDDEICEAMSKTDKEGCLSRIKKENR